MMYLIAQIVIVLGLAGLAFVFLDEYPRVASLPESDIICPRARCYWKITKKIGSKLRDGLEIGLQKILSYLRLSVMRTENLISRYLDHLRQKRKDRKPE